jgi:hypothetical protein
MRRIRSFAAALPLVGFALTPLAAQGAGSLVDEGTFVVTKAGAPAGTESFRIMRTDAGGFVATGRFSFDGSVVTSSLRTDSTGTPVQYGMNVNDGRTPVLKIVAAATGSRLSARSTDQRGDESMREYPLPAGRCLVLDDNLLHQTYFAGLGKRSGPVHVINTRASHPGSISVTERGSEPVDVGGHSVSARHYSLAGGAAAREFWVDGAGRLLRVEVPAQGIKATREELPR